jgi:hypothetical protein
MTTTSILTEIAARTADPLIAARMAFWRGTVERGGAELSEDTDTVSITLRSGYRSSVYKATGEMVPLVVKRGPSRPLTLREDGYMAIAARWARDIAQERSRQAGFQMELDL